VIRPDLTTEFALQLSPGSQIVTLRIANPTRPAAAATVRFALGTIDLLLDEARGSVTSGEGQVR
jgi:hypothetical protein